MPFNRLLPAMMAALGIVLGAAAHRRGIARRKPAWRPWLEILEDRLAPALTWIAAPIFGSGLWSDPQSWLERRPPLPGDDLVFLADSSHGLVHESFNDLPP